MSFPFTRLIPECVATLSSFIESAATFSRGDIELPDMDRLLIKTTEALVNDIPKTYVQLSSRLPSTPSSPSPYFSTTPHHLPHPSPHPHLTILILTVTLLLLPSEHLANL